MNWKDKIRPNALILAGLSTALFVGTGAALVIGAVMGFPVEILLILAVAVGAAGVKMVDFASAVAQDPPPPQIPESSAAMMLDKLRDWK